MTVTGAGLEDELEGLRSTLADLRLPRVGRDRDQAAAVAARAREYSSTCQSSPS